MNRPSDHGWNDSEDEQELDAVLAVLPDYPVSNHFTSQVMGQVRLEHRRTRSVNRQPWWRRWHALPGPIRVALAGCLVMAAAWPVHHRWEMHRRAEVARSLSTVTALAGVPTVGMLQDFEAIRRLDEVYPVPDLPAADVELLAALQ